MQKEGFVSLWAGNINSSEELDKLLQITYTADGEFVPSIFARNFGIKRYDDTVREADLYDESYNSLSRLLEGFSYDDVIIPRFTAILGKQLHKSYNAVISLYNFQYEGEKKEACIESSYLEFLGTAEYQ